MQENQKRDVISCSKLSQNKSFDKTPVDPTVQDTQGKKAEAGKRISDISCTVLARMLHSGLLESMTTGSGIH